MSTSSYPADAWGGVSIYQGGAPTTQLVPDGAQLVVSDWDEEQEIPHERYCTKQKKDGSQCRAYQVRDSDTGLCNLHLRHSQRET